MKPRTVNKRNPLELGRKYRKLREKMRRFAFLEDVLESLTFGIMDHGRELVTLVCSPLYLFTLLKE